MTGPLYAIGGFAARRGWLVVGAWVAIAAALLIASFVFGRPTNDDLTIPGSDSTRATDLLDNKLPGKANGTVPIAMKSNGSPLDQGAEKAAIQQVVQNYKGDDGVRSVVSPFSQEGSDQITKDGKYAYINLSLRDGQDTLDEDEAEDLIALADPAEKQGIEVAAGAYLGNEVSNPGTESSEALGIAVAIVVLLFAFGTAAAMPIPILTAIFGLSAGLSLIGLLGHLISVPSLAATLGTMLGLGVGIDYALFIVTRHRGFMAEGHEVHEAAARATATSGGAVLFAGGTVVIALLSLFFSGLPIVRALGYSAAIVVAVAVVTALTLLPAVLGLLGERINSLKLPFGGHPHDDQPHGWARWARGVGKRPWTAAIAGLAILIALALPLLDITLGQPNSDLYPKDTATKQSYDILTQGFGEGTNGPLLVSVELDPAAKPDTAKLNSVEAKQQKQEQQAQQEYEQQAQEAALAGEPPPPEPAGPTPAQQQQQQEQEKFLKSDASDTRLTKLSNEIAKDPDVDTVSLPAVSSDGSAAVLNVIPASGPSSDRTVDLVNRLRDDTIPKALGYPSKTKAFVGGSTAAYIDLADRIAEKLPLIIGIVVALSFLLLMVAFRSLLVPLKAAADEPALGRRRLRRARRGLPEGLGISLIGLDHTIPIVSFVPLLMFAILFGLSMDYEVFLLTQIQEHLQAPGRQPRRGRRGPRRHRAGDHLGGADHGRVFASFILNGDPTVKQFGVGLAVAVAIDATVVRCLLGARGDGACFGKSNWWFPGWLDRHLPSLGIEGEEYFREIDVADVEKAEQKDHADAS